MTAAKKAALGCIGTLIALPLAVPLNGYALSVLWGWFVVPLLHAAPLGIASACGVSLVVSMLTYHDTATDKDREWWVPVVGMFIRPLMALFFGSIYRAWL